MKAKQFCCLLLLLALLLPATGLAEDVAYVINPKPEDRLHLRDKPSGDGESLGKYYTGTVVEVLGQNGDYSNVRVGNQRGYMLREFLTNGNVSFSLGEWGIVNVKNVRESVHIRGEAQKGAKSRGMLPNGAAVQILDETDEYYHVRALETDGYILKAFILPEGGEHRTPLTPLAQGEVGENVNLRAFPDRKAPSLGTCPGQSVAILGTVGVWYYVECHSDIPAERQRGFILGQYVTPYDAGTQPPYYAVVSAEAENERTALRGMADAKGASMGEYFNGTQVEVLDHADGTWWKVRIDGRDGYMPAKNLQGISQAWW